MRSLKFAQEEIMNYGGESTFIQRETGETGLDMVQYRVGREEASAVALACTCNKFTNKVKQTSRVRGKERQISKFALGDKEE